MQNLVSKYCSNLSAHPHTKAPAHKCIYKNIHITQFTTNLNRHLWWRKVAAWSGKSGRTCFGKRNVLRLDLSESREGFFSERKGKVIPHRGQKMEKVHALMQSKVWYEESGS